MKITRALGFATATLLALSACGSDGTTSTTSPSTARGTLAEDPPLRIASLDAADFNSQLTANPSAQQLLLLAGTPTCGVDFYDLKFWTVGGAGESTESSGALMVPTGAAPGCSGPRPIVLYAHGTQANKLLNLADITNAGNTEGAEIAAMYAAQGYIVVAPNYAGYDISTLGYHPFLNATQQSAEMMDILAAARTALPNTLSAATKDSGQLFVTGYSEGGHVAVATVKALEANGQTVTGVSGGSGPYALEAFGDALMFGNVDLGSTEFSPLLTTSYQHEYQNIYQSPSDIYSSTYASGIETVLPSATPISTLYANNVLPATALFDSATPTVTVPGNIPLSSALTAALEEPSPNSSALAPLFDLGFSNPNAMNNSYLINNSVRVAYALDAAADPDGEDTALTGMAASASLAAATPSYPLRKAFNLNDMRSWYGSVVPGAPLLMCGGENDPTVFYSVNTGTMAAFWSDVPTVSTLDVDPPTASGTYAAIQAGFKQYEAQEIASVGLAAWEENYHIAVAPFCALAARSFFAAILAE